AIPVESVEREHAFGEAEVRLVSTVAARLAVALENARLFDETQRLFQAEQQRAAELAVINSIQQGMAAKLDFQAIIDLVGDKLRQVFHTGDLSIRWWDEKSGITHWLYVYEHGKRLQLQPTQLSTRGPTLEALTSKQAQVANTRDLSYSFVPGTDKALCVAVIPIVGSDRAMGT